MSTQTKPAELQVVPGGFIQRIRIGAGWGWRLYDEERQPLPFGTHFGSARGARIRVQVESAKRQATADGEEDEE